MAKKSKQKECKIAWDKELDIIKKDANSQDNVSSIIPALQNKQLQLFISQWKYIKCRFTPVNCSKPTSDVWDWLWENTIIDRGNGFTMSEKMYTNLFNTAKQMRLIFPDGTINKWASHYLSKLAMSMIKKLDYTE